MLVQLLLSIAVTFIIANPPSRVDNANSLLSASAGAGRLIPRLIFGISLIQISVINLKKHIGRNYGRISLGRISNVMSYSSCEGEKY